MNKTPEIGQIPSPRSINGLHLKQKQDTITKHGIIYFIFLIRMSKFDLRLKVLNQKLFEAQNVLLRRSYIELLSICIKSY